MQEDEAARGESLRKAAGPLHYAWVVLAMGTLVVFGALGLARFGYSMLLPAMQVGLRLDNTQAGLLATANLAGYLPLALIGGALASRFGPRRVIAAGLCLAGLGMLSTGLVHGFAGAVVWRALTGVGSGASNVAVMGLLSSWFGVRRRGLAAGIAVSGSALALMLLGPLVPWILARSGEEAGWRLSWFLFGGLTLVVALSGLLILRNRPSEKGLRPLGEASVEPAAARGGPEAAPLPQPGKLSWGSVYRSRRVWHLGMVYTAYGFSYIIYMTFFVKYLTVEAGYTGPQAGNLFMVMGWSSLFCGLLWGAVSDRIGRGRALMIVYLIQSTAFGLFAAGTGGYAQVLSAVLFGFTAWSIPAIMAAACGDVLGPRMAPAALGFITLFMGIGQAVAPGIAGAMADATDSFSSAFLLASAAAFLGFLGAWRIRLPAPRPEHAACPG